MSRDALVLTLMPDEHKKDTYHVFLVDMVTENYQFIRTLTSMTLDDAKLFTVKLANHHPDELHQDAESLGKWIDAQLKQEDRTDGRKD